MYGHAEPHLVTDFENGPGYDENPYEASVKGMVG